MKLVTTSGRMREPDAAANRSDRPLYLLRTSSGSSMIRSNITGTTQSPVARCRSINSSVASGSNLRRVMTVHAIDAAKMSCEKPHAWNIGATTTTDSSACHGVRSRMALRIPGPPSVPPECLAPLGLPVVPDVSRMTLLFLRALAPSRCGRLPGVLPIIVSTVRPPCGPSVHATIRVASGLSASARSTVAVNSSS